MPRKSAKAKLVDDIFYSAATDLLLLDSSAESEEEDEIHDNLNESINLVTWNFCFKSATREVLL